MGFSTVAAAAILGGSFIMIATIISGSTIPTLSNYHDAMKNLENRAIERIHTYINITNITNTSGLNYDLNITVRNTGKISLDTSDFTILINGTFIEFNTSTSYIYPDNEGIFTINLSGTGLKAIKVITANGITDYEKYIVQ